MHFPENDMNGAKNDTKGIPIPLQPFSCICYNEPIGEEKIYRKDEKLMHKILIVEDDTVQCLTIKKTIQKQYPTWTVDTAADLEEGIEKLNLSLQENKYYTLFLLDVQLSEENTNRGGFLLSNEIRKHTVYFRTPILFLTAISDEGNFALSKFHCYNYIAKPYTEDDILFQIEQMLLTGYLQYTIDLTDTNRIHHKIFINDIYAIESKAHSLIVHLETESFVTREYTLKQIFKILPSIFVQCHKQFIINKQCIENYDITRKYIKVGNLHIPIGKTYLNIIPTLFHHEI